MTMNTPVINTLTTHGSLKSQLCWLRSGCTAALMVLASGCQLLDMASFSYANANSTHHWATDARTTTVAFTMVDNHIILPVSINGSEPLNFVLDSGAGATVIIESDRTRALPLELGAEMAVSGVGTGPDPVARVVKEVDLSLGDIRLMGQSVIYLPLASIPFFDDLDDVYFDGVVGYPFFRRFVITINYDKQLISFSEPTTAGVELDQFSDAWQELPLQIQSNVPYVAAQVRTGSEQTVAVKLLVDTGYRGPISLTPSTHDELEEPVEYFPAVSQGLSGDVESRVAMAEFLTLGSYRLNKLPVSYEISGGESDDDSNGLLGNEVLSRFNLVFDYPNERLFLSPNQRFSVPLVADRSGLQVRPHRSGGIIKNIAQGSTGEVIDIQVGDIITSFDDTPVTPVTIGELKRALGSGQDTLRLCWLSGEQSRCEDLKLASRFSE